MEEGGLDLSGLRHGQMTVCSELGNESTVSSSSALEEFWIIEGPFCINLVKERREVGTASSEMVLAWSVVVCSLYRLRLIQNYCNGTNEYKIFATCFDWYTYDGGCWYQPKHVAITLILINLTFRWPASW